MLTRPLWPVKHILAPASICRAGFAGNWESQLSRGLVAVTRNRISSIEIIPWGGLRLWGALQPIADFW